jgi:hypothetical protein
MLKNILITFALLMVILGGALYTVDGRIPAVAQKQASLALRDMGFPAAKLPKPQVRFGAMRFENIPLDEKALSTIGRMDIGYNPLDMFFRRRLRSVSIDKLNLTGKILPGGVLSLTGWDANSVKWSPQNFPLKTLDIQSANVLFMTELLGGVSVTFDAQARTRLSDIQIQGNVVSKQKGLGFSARVTGQAGHDGLWQLNAEIEEGKSDIAGIKTSRGTGTLEITGQPGETPKIAGELRAGGLSLRGFPWQNISATIEAQGLAYTTYLDAKSVGHEGIELAITSNTEGVTGSVHAPDLGTLLKYLSDSHAIIIDAKAAAALAHVKDVSIDFTPSVEKTNFIIKDESGEMAIEGTINTNENGYTATLSSAPLFLSTLDKFLTGEKPANLGFKNGKATVAGDIESGGEKFTGNFKMQISDGVYAYGPMSLKNIEGALTIDDLSTLSHKGTQNFTCALPLKDVSQTCAIETSFKNGALRLKKLDISIFGGHITATDFRTPSAVDSKIALDVLGIDLALLSEKLGIPGLSFSGKAKGLLPLDIKDGKAVIVNGKLSAEGPGIVRYAYDKPPAFFQGDPLELETMKLALENFNYTTFEIGLNGPINDEMNITIKTTGKNPSLPAQQPVTLEMQAKASLKPLFKNILKD